MSRQCPALGLVPPAPRCSPRPLFPQVMQVLNADAIVVKLNSGDHKTIHLSSIRPPRLEGDSTQVTVGMCGGEVTQGDGGGGSAPYPMRAAVANVRDPPWMEAPPHEAPLPCGLTPLARYPLFLLGGAPRRPWGGLEHVL